MDFSGSVVDTQFTSVKLDAPSTSKPLDGNGNEELRLLSNVKRRYESTSTSESDGTGCFLEQDKGNKNSLENVSRRKKKLARIYSPPSPTRRKTSTPNGSSGKKAGLSRMLGRSILLPEKKETKEEYEQQMTSSERELAPPSTAVQKFVPIWKQKLLVDSPQVLDPYQMPETPPVPRPVIGGKIPDKKKTVAGTSQLSKSKSTGRLKSDTTSGRSKNKTKVSQLSLAGAMSFSCLIHPLGDDSPRTPPAQVAGPVAGRVASSPHPAALRASVKRNKDLAQSSSSVCLTSSVPVVQPTVKKMDSSSSEEVGKLVPSFGFGSFRHSGIRALAKSKSVLNLADSNDYTTPPSSISRLAGCQLGVSTTDLRAVRKPVLVRPTDEVTTGPSCSTVSVRKTLKSSGSMFNLRMTPERRRSEEREVESDARWRSPGKRMTSPVRRMTSPRKKREQEGDGELVLPKQPCEITRPTKGLKHSATVSDLMSTERKESMAKPSTPSSSPRKQVRKPRPATPTSCSVFPGTVTEGNEAVRNAVVDKSSSPRKQIRKPATPTAAFVSSGTVAEETHSNKFVSPSRRARSLKHSATVSDFTSVVVPVVVKTSPRKAVRKIPVDDIPACSVEVQPSREPETTETRDAIVAAKSAKPVSLKTSPRKAVRKLPVDDAPVSAFDLQSLQEPETAVNGQDNIDANNGVKADSISGIVSETADLTSSEATESIDATEKEEPATTYKFAPPTPLRYLSAESHRTNSTEQSDDEFFTPNQSMNDFEQACCEDDKVDMVVEGLPAGETEFPLEAAAARPDAEPTDEKTPDVADACAGTSNSTEAEALCLAPLADVISSGSIIDHFADPIDKKIDNVTDSGEKEDIQGSGISESAKNENGAHTVNENDTDNRADSVDSKPVVRSILKARSGNATSRDSRARRRIQFEAVDVFYFARQQGGDTIPHEGEITLGMVPSHFTRRQFSLSSGRRPILTLEEEREEDEVLSEGEEISGRYDPLGYEHCSTAYFDRVEPKKRVKMLKKVGIRAEKPSLPLDFIRQSRLVCGCSCRNGICRPETCECHLNGINCQVDGPLNDGTPFTHPCWCTEATCHNPQGRLEFLPDRVQLHHSMTIQRLLAMDRSGNYSSPQITRFYDDEDKLGQEDEEEIPPATSTVSRTWTEKLVSPVSLSCQSVRSAPDSAHPLPDSAHQTTPVHPSSNSSERTVLFEKLKTMLYHPSLAPGSARRVGSPPIEHHPDTAVDGESPIGKTPISETPIGATMSDLGSSDQRLFAPSPSLL